MRKALMVCGAVAIALVLVHPFGHPSAESRYEAAESASSVYEALDLAAAEGDGYVFVVNDDENAHRYYVVDVANGCEYSADDLTGESLIPTYSDMQRTQQRISPVWLKWKGLV